MNTYAYIKNCAKIFLILMKHKDGEVHFPLDVLHLIPYTMMGGRTDFSAKVLIFLLYLHIVLDYILSTHSGSLEHAVVKNKCQFRKDRHTRCSHEFGI